MDKLIEKCANAIGFHLLDTGVYDHAKDADKISHELAEIAIPIIQQALKQALKDSRDNKDIDLPEEWYELFNSIRNSGVQALLDEIEAELVESDSRNMWYLNKGFFDSLKENRDV